MAWFILNDPNFPADSSQYSPAATPLRKCGGDQDICRINAADDGTGHPVLNTTVLGEMVTALNTRTESANIKLKQ